MKHNNFAKQKDLKFELRQLLQTKNRNMSDSLKTNKLRTEDRIAESMKAQGLQTIKSMRPRHIEKYLQDVNQEWKDGKGKGADMTSGSLATHLTVLRDIADAIGKSNIVDRGNAAYGANRTREQRENPQRLDKANDEKAFENLGKKSNGECWQIAKSTADTIGLRKKEQLYTKDMLVKIDDERVLISLRSSADLREVSMDALRKREYGASIFHYLKNAEIGVPQAIVEGAKQGQVRLEPLNTDVKLAAMELRMSYIREHNQKSMMPNKYERGGSAYNAYTGALKRAGYTKANNCNPHRARAHYAQTEKASGRSPWSLAEGLGHHRLSILNCYIPK